MDDALLGLAQRKVAQMTITASSARGCAKGTIEKVHAYLSDQALLRELAALAPADFPAWMDRHTSALAQHVTLARSGSVSWGHARKFLSLFLFTASRDYLLRANFKLDVIDDWLEVPVDRHVAQGLTRYAHCEAHSPGDGVPPWQSIAELDAQQNCRYQLVATSAATQLGVTRGQLDYLLWRAPDAYRTCVVCVTAL